MRWVVERTFSRLENFRRLAKDYEYTTRLKAAWLSGMFSFWKTFLFSKYVSLLIYSIIFYYLGKLFNSRNFRNDIIWQVFVLLLILHPLFKRQIKD
ncbi:hypothetical protein Barb6_01606 [Bacteroidales bacterium Barb6]|nr:hypothetical protein Barb6_01606 [Bacteroidales bacterium Barb6]